MTQQVKANASDLIADFVSTREKTMQLFRPLNIEDAVIQSDPFGSPPNWHLAHVTWFFQKVLEKHGHKFDENVFQGNNVSYLNSYYQKYGNILAKSERGKFPRPTVEQTIKYRSIIDSEVVSFLKQQDQLMRSSDIAYDIILGVQHEMQHQELMVYDFQHYFQRFLDPDDNYRPIAGSRTSPTPLEKPTGVIDILGGIYKLGFSSNKGHHHFCYDNELPEHKVYLEPYSIDAAPVTNEEFAKFVDDGGYRDYKYWLADGWDLVQEQEWTCPLYWEERNGRWIKKDFHGIHELDPETPVVNISYYEADAYARWCGKRLPTEAEWEKAASWDERLQRKTIYPWGDNEPTQEHANLMESWIWSPAKIGSYPKGKSHYGCHQMIGDVWEWTSSEYVLYPGFQSKFEEYTDKWAINQKVLRGGCFATPLMQIRNSYRNYFKPNERILFAGFRCAKDAKIVG